MRLFCLLSSSGMLAVFKRGPKTLHRRQSGSARPLMTSRGQPVPLSFRSPLPGGRYWASSDPGPPVNSPAFSPSHSGVGDC